MPCVNSFHGNESMKGFIDRFDFLKLAGSSVYNQPERANYSLDVVLQNIINFFTLNITPELVEVD